MPCFLIVIALLLPRVTMFFIWLLTDWFSRAYESILWPFLGFFFMPYTTLVYMAAMLNNNRQIDAGWLVAIVIAVVVDLSHHGATARRGSRW
jgi:hypothetical protein